METDSLKDSRNDEQVTGEFTEQLKMKELTLVHDPNHENDESDDDSEYEIEIGEDGDEEEEEEFSFARGTDAPPITAEEIFYNGQIRPLFPLFNQKLLLSDDDLEKMKERSPVKKVFIETEGSSQASSSENQEIAGPYCEWSKNKAVEASPEVCKKSNSTGFSKLWRFKDFLHRSNSDGRDAFVFLNPEKVDRKSESTSSENKDSYQAKVKVNDHVSSQKKKKKIIVKKSEAVKAHEAYLKSKAKHDNRLRSHLPYRPELVGFFTNVNGGLTRNVHPF